MLWDKILFVIKLQKLQKQVSLCHPSRMWETHPNDYWVFSKMADLLYHSFPGPPLSKMATDGNRWLDVVDLLLISVCSIEAGDTEKKTSEKFV